MNSTLVEAMAKKIVFYCLMCNMTVCGRAQAWLGNHASIVNQSILTRPHARVSCINITDESTIARCALLFRLQHEKPGHTRARTGIDLCVLYLAATHSYIDRRTLKHTAIHYVHTSHNWTAKQTSGTPRQLSIVSSLLTLPSFHIPVDLLMHSLPLLAELLFDGRLFLFFGQLHHSISQDAPDD